ncbi:HAD family hydrolase [Brucella anthropi]|uniref:HAD-superfamily hydrolase, subfamily IA, variant 1 n=1 Tax=Brucella anthropi (strain ATCC 49188 / DSM 6882 / CCUG 24695 / JCM 21032 / LMG 3331 / NBRC 15819 / NCTC 12168 / Alc 37) TaxID=439375 RepID=A6X2K2_BRUA4|nr:HAD family hydrolase [Brucella anthropi]ABS15456.1 HAD-superfamily hydrolase, subfamily IA, variant 1 [Brucella anthropi ATCC 49188]QQC24345.1 HAD family hydrolase [Brucella anthropi]
MHSDQPSAACFSEISLDGVKGVLTDLDGTLYAYKPCHQYALKTAFEYASYGLEQEAFFNLYRNARNRVTARLASQGAGRSRLFAFQLMGEELGWRAPFLAARELDRIYWQSFIEHMTADQEALRLLERCNDADIPVCVVTDMTVHVQIDKLKRLRLENRITHLVTSEETGVEKPDPRMFEAGLRKLGIGAFEAIMLGDDLRKDIQGASALGIRPYLVCLDKPEEAS